MFKEKSKIKKECPVCEVERDLAYGEIDEILKVRGEDIKVVSKIYYCTAGDHYFYDVEDEEEKFQMAYREYRKRKGLLQPDEIRQIREQYDLSQKNFARLLGWGEITIHRYESGAIQDDAHNDILSAIKKDLNFFKTYLYTRKEKINPKLFKKFEEKIDEIESKRQFEILFKLSSRKIVKSVPALIKSAIQSDYLEFNKDFEYCDNKEFALAA